ncbi:hypothetical protein PFICI_06549 [Pestalotiopsis fici W106-1]|uniref:Uncharacterized protein n=1 Tax=Pestalotiopsis fici (strain W106-1 / CGMCC3.15140) TaxID=1229662 RepID=W3X817_PESFW|nr:uncharacterized protein PFICI_06549 [Pestalotiopsis fici W106-1]ETS81547.1 hypothetical protein PFICI_06549 [Pestalotiopsis fici W106-1]
MVRIWAVDTGTLQRTIEAETRTLSFDPLGDKIRTDSRIFDLQSQSRASQDPQDVPFGPEYIQETSSLVASSVALGISNDRTWITHNSERVMWIPPIHRPESHDVFESTIALGGVSGQITILRFSESHLNAFLS